MDMRPLTVGGRVHSVELRHLRSFLVIAASESLTEAAARLGISQPSLSAQLAFLEDKLGVRLFDRDRSGIRITVDGRRLHDLITGPVVALNAALLEFPAEGVPVSVVAPPDLGPGLRAAAEAALRDRFPARPVQWRPLPPQERVAAFRARTVQALVEWAPVVGSGGIMLRGRTLGLLMAATSPLAPLSVVHGSDLVGHPVARLEGEDHRIFENIWAGLLDNGWSPRAPTVVIASVDDLAADPRAVLVAPEPEDQEHDPRLTWRPFLVPFAESAWLGLS
ncbi:LysR family transcriptional regulator [Raineyella fluvialis]|uniref:LysR family transcriptional regulator n=1 Tax=Raineyella fluvialis TaxID=2662261 RepID=A0A5Q2FAT0_9ACTN|nr:LysR family transcriptional regulator [Raineyella fluvialis]QGF23808.1 LysR family transcriptional regulator [Raineyella fluvialis]